MRVKTHTKYTGRKLGIVHAFSSKNNSSGLTQIAKRVFEERHNSIVDESFICKSVGKHRRTRFNKKSNKIDMLNFP